MSRINAIYGTNAEIFHVKLGSVYSYTDLYFQTVITVNKSAWILSKHVRPNQFFPLSNKSDIRVEITAQGSYTSQ